MIIIITHLTLVGVPFYYFLLSNDKQLLCDPTLCLIMVFNMHLLHMIILLSVFVNVLLCIIVLKSKLLAAARP